MSELKRYTVTERAGPRVAGRRVKPGEIIELTMAEAAYERGNGTIVPEGTQLSPAFSADSASLKDLRIRAGGKEPAAPEADPKPAPARKRGKAADAAPAEGA